MADIPQGAELIPTESRIPQIKVRNVFIFPGVPNCCVQNFQPLSTFSLDDKFHGKVFLNALLSLLLPQQLSNAQDRNPDVDLGSYPRMGEVPSLILTIQGFNKVRVAEVQSELEKIFFEFLNPSSYPPTN